MGWIMFTWPALCMHTAQHECMIRIFFCEQWFHAQPCVCTGLDTTSWCGGSWPGHASHGYRKRIYKGNGQITWWIMRRFNDFNGFLKLIHRQFTARINDSLLPLAYISYRFTHSFVSTWWITGVIKELIRINGLYDSPSEHMIHPLNGLFIGWINWFTGESMYHWSTRSRQRVGSQGDS